MSTKAGKLVSRWGAWDWDTTEAIAALRQQQEDEDSIEEPNRLTRRPCSDCGGTGLSPYPDDGGSCPHCIDGYVS